MRAWIDALNKDALALGYFGLCYAAVNGLLIGYDVTRCGLGYGCKAPESASARAIEIAKVIDKMERDHPGGYRWKATPMHEAEE